MAAVRVLSGLQCAAPSAAVAVLRVVKRAVSTAGEDARTLSTAYRSTSASYRPSPERYCGSSRRSSAV